MNYAQYFWNSYTVGILWIIYILMVASCIIVVLSENRNPIRTLTWILALIFLPGIGLIFYAFFGRSLRGQHIMSRRNKRKLMHDQKGKQLDLNQLDLMPVERQLVKLTYKVSKYPLTLNNSAEIFTDGASKFEALKKDLRKAKESIYLQYYIFKDDSLGKEIAEILIEKAKQGVEVKVIYDHVGSFSSRNKFFKYLVDNGVEAHPFFRVSFPQLANRINWRNHRKVVVIDSSIGYIGGMNIADRYLGKQPDGSYWRDTHLRVEGDVVSSLLHSFIIDWNFLKKDITSIPKRTEQNNLHNSTGMQLITSGPTGIWDNLGLIFLKAISGASKCIYIQTPYFLPTDSTLHALEAAAMANVDVRIMLPSKCDSKMLEYAGFSYISRCLKAGIKVYLYNPGMLHSKVMIIDDSFVTTGSVNLDFRSFENNFEGNLLIFDKDINRKMKDIFFHDLSYCRKLTLTSWQKRPVTHKLLESILRLLAPIL